MSDSISENEINKLISSDAYQSPSHPYYPSIRQKVTDWFAQHYGNRAMQTDATGRLIKERPEKSSHYTQPWNSIGNALFVGEGNLSFASNITKMPGNVPSKIISTTYESKEKIADTTKQNASLLARMGAAVNHGIDATKISEIYPYTKFDTVIFQFPNVGSRKAKQGHNPNFILIRDFLKSAKICLKPDGKVLISAVNNPHYHGVFQFEEAAKTTGFMPPEIYPFDPSAFPTYSHSNTNDDDSALENHDKFSTWVFRLKQ